MVAGELPVGEIEFVPVALSTPRRVTAGTVDSKSSERNKLEYVLSACAAIWNG